MSEYPKIEENGKTGFVIETVNYPDGSYVETIIWEDGTETMRFSPCLTESHKRHLSTFENISIVLGCIGALIVLYALTHGSIR